MSERRIVTDTEAAKWRASPFGLSEAEAALLDTREALVEALEWIASVPGLLHDDPDQGFIVCHRDMNAARALLASIHSEEAEK